MAQRVETLDLSTLSLSSGEARTLEVAVPVGALEYGGERYSPAGDLDASLDVSRTTGAGYALRLRFEVSLDGPCMRCLESAHETLAVDVREIDQPDGGDDENLRSPYLDGHELDLCAWARDAAALSVPTQIVCREDCRGLCPRCGVNLNREPDHAHDAEPDPRWAKLSELLE